MCLLSNWNQLLGQVSDHLSATHNHLLYSTNPEVLSFFSKVEWIHHEKSDNNLCWYSETSLVLVLCSVSRRYLYGFLLTPFSMWNLDFFRLVYSPFCLHPHASMLHILSLDYITTAYPLVLIIFTYTLVTRHYHGCPLVL